MSIKQFYRTNVAFVEVYTIWVDGRAENAYTPPVWVKGNLQPFKQGMMVGTTDEYLTTFTDWKTLYVKNKHQSLEVLTFTTMVNGINLQQNRIGLQQAEVLSIGKY